jgi:hypothetical protein
LARTVCDTEGGEREKRWKEVRRMRAMVKGLLDTVRCHLRSEEGQLADSPFTFILIVGTSLAWLALIAMLGASLFEALANGLG